MPPTNQIVVLPKLRKESPEDELPVALAHKLKDFRLHSLKTSPEAFARTYEEEVDLDIGFSFDRLSTPKATYFVALSGDSSASVQDEHQIRSLVASKWVGMIVSFGPQNPTPGGISVAKDPFTKMTTENGNFGVLDGGAEAVEASGPRSQHYHLNGMFVSPEARGSGMAKQLLLRALKRAEAECRGSGCDLECTIFVGEQNHAALKVYESVGFVAAGTETYTPSHLRPGEAPGAERVAIKLNYEKRLQPE